MDAAIVRRKLRRIRLNLETLGKILYGMTAETYAADEMRRRATERLLQETVDAAVDANNHLLRGAGVAVPDDYYRSFIELGRAGILNETLARELAPATGLRNKIVHEYEELDDARILQAALEAPVRLHAYLGALEQYLERQGL